MTALRTVRRILVMHAPLQLSMRLMIVFEAVYIFVHIPQGTHTSRVIKNVCLQLCMIHTLPFLNMYMHNVYQSCLSQLPNGIMMIL